MAEQMSTPESNGDTSINGSKMGLPKDKSCPFCQQNFTSSSLGRHLDLYIKEKNPKPPDGVHDVVEIRKLRGGITRRQPRNSASRREGSTPLGTPAAMERRASQTLVPEHRSPSPRRDSILPEIHNFKSRQGVILNGGSWEATGVMNHIPAARHPEATPSRHGEDLRDGTRRLEGRNRSVSRQVVAKATLEHKHKIVDALDEARAAELALRELLGAFRAAKTRIEGPDLFDYDPLSLDFPALCLQCLPPPPTLQQSTAPPTASSWSILPPEEQQYNALRAHFSDAFHNWRVACAITNTGPRDDLSYPPPPVFAGHEDREEMVQRAEAEASVMENKISEHLHNVFAHWLSISLETRTELWTLELARNVGRKSDEISKLKKEKELAQQEAVHKQLQIEELSRLQQPKEFCIQPPETLALSGQEMADLGDASQKCKGTRTGFTTLDRGLDLDLVVKRAIGRWKGVIKQARGASGEGLAEQRSLGEDLRDVSGTGSSSAGGPTHAPKALMSNRGHDHGHSRTHSHAQNGYRDERITTMNGAHSDPDAEGDAEMDEDDGRYDNIPDGSVDPRIRNGMLDGSNGHGFADRSDIRGMEKHTYVGGYVRIDA